MILTALLVILVPEWLDGAGHKSRYPDRIEIPAIPEFKPMPEPRQPAPPVQVEVAAASKANKQQPTEVQAQPEEQAEATAAAKSSIHAWALQVGSFNDESNARVMRDRMRAEGYAAYIHEQKSRGKMHYRVRIGPELDRDRVDKLKDEILSKEKIKGMVVNHP